jgi:pimeloyl-ACP methyl ester carboxylesterase
MMKKNKKVRLMMFAFQGAKGQNRRYFMRKTFLTVVLLLMLIVGSSGLVPGPGGPQENIEGCWLGVLKVEGSELRVVFNISLKADGTLTAVIDSPDQGATDIPVDEVIYKEGQLILHVKSIGGVFEGKVAAGGQEIEGAWKQGGLSLPLTVKRTGKRPVVNRPQEPQKPYPYNEEEVVYENAPAGVKLAGTLTLPRSGGPFPAVLLITGSGAQDRNETVFGHRPFLVLADYLTRRNIAVLRVDDRGIGGSSGKDSQPTTRDFADDVLAGVRFLKTRPEINPQKIGLIGHSEGGIVAPMVAAQSADVAFIVMMAGTSLTGEEIILRQSALIAKAEGKNDDDIAKSIGWQKKIFSVLKNEPDNAAAEKEIRSLLNKSLADLSEDEKKEIGDPENYINTTIKQMLNPWLRFALAFDPKTVLIKVKCPVLAIIGEKDLQVPAKESLQGIEQALKAGGNKNYIVKELPGLNHLFQTAGTGSPSEYARIAETMSPTVLKLIGDWITKQSASSSSFPD